MSSNSLSSYSINSYWLCDCRQVTQPLRVSGLAAFVFETRTVKGPEQNKYKQLASTTNDLNSEHIIYIYINNSI